MFLFHFHQCNWVDELNRLTTPLKKFNFLKIKIDVCHHRFFVRVSHPYSCEKMKWTHKAAREESWEVIFICLSFVSSNMHLLQKHQCKTPLDRNMQTTSSRLCDDTEDSPLFPVDWAWLLFLLSSAFDPYSEPEQCTVPWGDKIKDCLFCDMN